MRVQVVALFIKIRHVDWVGVQSCIISLEEFFLFVQIQSCFLQIAIESVQKVGKTFAISYSSFLKVISQKSVAMTILADRPTGETPNFVCCLISGVMWSINDFSEVMKWRENRPDRD